MAIEGGVLAWSNAGLNSFGVTKKNWLKLEKETRTLVMIEIRRTSSTKTKYTYWVTGSQTKSVGGSLWTSVYPSVQKTLTYTSAVSWCIAASQVKSVVLHFVPTRVGGYIRSLYAHFMAAILR